MIPTTLGSGPMGVLLELDPNIVKPGWTPLLITIGIALVMVLLFRSMRRQFRRVDDNFPEPEVPVSGSIEATDPDAAGPETTASGRFDGVAPELSSSSPDEPVRPV